MNHPIIVFYHCYLYNGTPADLKPWAFNVVTDQMHRLTWSGLEKAATEIIVGLNGGEESLEVARLIMPEKAKVVLHGLDSKCENPTLVLLENWLKQNPGEAHVLYFHAKGSSHDPQSDYGGFDGRWRECMMRNCIDNWRQCVADLNVAEAVGCHWLTGQGWDHSQHYFAGTFFWARASFLRTLPSIMLRERIKVSGLGALESRYEAEVWIGNGPRLPTIRDYHPGGIAH
jgi:hypothetical protein